ncbi:MAG: RsmE family RNA methyltransferase, partial [Anaerotignum sp.]|nr:RsmE family RNA methyltransferase [Anaerotignum sp.]
RPMFRKRSKKLGELNGYAEEMLSGCRTIQAYEREEETGIRQFVQNFKGESVGVFIGPEGGFADEEIALAQGNGITPITLGKRILRTETAGMTTTAILLYELD